MKVGLIFKRIGAYLIDFFIITFISSALIYLAFLNPKYDEYMTVSEEYENVINDYYESNIDITEFTEKVQVLSYDMNKNGYVYIIGDIVIAFLYFGVFAYFTKGQTLGKKLMGIKIVNAKSDNPLKIYNYLIRTLMLNGIILNIVTLIAICFSKSTYYKIYNYGSNFDTILMIVIFLMILYNKDGRGLHDLLAGTKVVIANRDEKIELIGNKKEDKENE